MTDKEKIKAKIEQLMYGFNLEADIASCEDVEAEKLANIKYQVCKKILEYIDSMQEESANEDLDAAADKYSNNDYNYFDVLVTEYDGTEHWMNDKVFIKDAFKAGAKWQKEHMSTEVKEVDKDCLTWEDLATIEKLGDDFVKHNQTPMSDEEFYKEVLKRFKLQK